MDNIQLMTIITDDDGSQRFYDESFLYKIRGTRVSKHLRSRQDGVNCNTGIIAH